MDRKLDCLQVLRGLAALGVVFSHSFRALTVKRPDYIDMPIWWLEPHPMFMTAGRFGVEIFFTLSGFLMMYIAGPYFRRERSPGDFVLQRILRIWPLYALVSAVVLLRSVSGGDTSDLSPLRLLSFAFIPSYDAGGALRPILGVGWTLNYEMMFYCLFALVLWTGERWAFAKLAALFVAAFAIGLTSTGAVGEFLSDPIIFCFLLGALVGQGLRAGTYEPRHGLVWLIAGLGLMGSAVYFEHPLSSTAVHALAPLLVFVGFLGLKDARWPAPLRFIGDASYSIYLVHMLVIREFVSRALHHMPDFLGPFQILAVGAATFAISTAAGCAAYVLIEKPIVAGVRRWMTSRRRSVATA